MLDIDDWKKRKTFGDGFMLITEAEAQNVLDLESTLRKCVEALKDFRNCPGCDVYMGRSHNAGCAIGKALSEAEKYLGDNHD